MYESDIQTEVSSAIIRGEADHVDLAISDSENVVLVEVESGNAAYTADEARKLAKNLKNVCDQRWEGDNDDIVEYIRDLAAVVDGDKGADDVQDKWEQKGLDLEL